MLLGSYLGRKTQPALEPPAIEEVVITETIVVDTNQGKAAEVVEEMA